MVITSSTSTVADIDGIYYFVQHQVVVAFGISAEPIHLLTPVQGSAAIEYDRASDAASCLTLNEKSDNSKEMAWIASVLRKFANSDDVHTEYFHNVMLSRRR